VRPDVVFPTLRLAIFVDGCFWHGCTKHRSLPSSNADFWREKIEGTRRRDREQSRWLEAAGWTVVRTWEHDVPEPAVQAIVDVVGHLRGVTPTG